MLPESLAGSSCGSSTTFDAIVSDAIGRPHSDDARVWVALLVESSGNLGTHGPDALRVCCGLQHLLLAVSRGDEHGADHAGRERADDRQAQLFGSCPGLSVHFGTARRTHARRLAHGPTFVVSSASCLTA
jgi:hypothetical protein